MLYWDYLDEVQTDWHDVDISDLADFIHWLRSPTGSVISLQEQEAKRTEATINLILSSVCMLYDFHEKSGNVSEIPLYGSQFVPNG